MESKIPITRLSKFIQKSDYDFDISLGVEYLHGDLNMRLVLYRVNRETTPTNNVYAEVGKDEIKFLPPVEFNALVKIESPTNKTYNSGINRFNEPGNLILSVYTHHLDELNVDIKYGDYIGYVESENKIRFYNVVNDGKVISDGTHSMFGYKSFYRTITCSPTQENEFRGV